MASIHDRNALVDWLFLVELSDLQDHDVTATHAHGNLGEVVQRAHTVDRLGRFNRLDQLEAELVEDEDATIPTAYEDVVESDGRRVHLAALDVKMHHWIRLVSAIDVNVVLLVIDDENVLTDSLDVLDLMTLDPMHVCWCLIGLVQVLEAPDLPEVLLPHHLICVELGALDLRKHLETLSIELDQGLATRSASLEGIQSARRSLVGRGGQLIGLHRRVVSSVKVCFFGCLAVLMVDHFSRRTDGTDPDEALVDEDFKIGKLSLNHSSRDLLIQMLLDAVYVVLEELLPARRIEDLLKVLGWRYRRQF